MEKVKKYCFIFFVLLLLTPMIQRFVKFHTFENLNGMAAPKQFPTFHYKDWKSGDYQKMVDKFLSGNFGYRNFLVRTLNSFDYAVFKSSNNKKLLIGKDNYLFFSYNINRYLGIDTQNRRKVDSLFLMTDTLISYLDERDIEYLYVIAPSNAFYYSDKFPKQYDSYTKIENDYDYYLKKLEEHDVNYIDFNQWFLDIKDTVSIELFPKNGTHYTYSSAVLVADSLIKYMEHLKGIDVPDIITDDYVIDTMKDYEHDLENILNLGHDLPNNKMMYYNLKFDTVGKYKPKVLTVGDSFYWPITNQMIPASCFSNVAYWFYNLTVYPESFTKKKTPAEVDLDELFNGLDFIVIISSATLLQKYDYDGFIGDMIDYCTGEYSKCKRNDEVEYWVSVMKNNPEWLESIKEKANYNNRPLEEQLIKEAEWLINKKNK